VLSRIAAEHEVLPPLDWATLKDGRGDLSSVPADIVQMLDVFNGANLVDGMTHPLRFLTRSRYVEMESSGEYGDTTTIFATLADERRVGYRYVRELSRDPVKGLRIAVAGWDIVVVVLQTRVSLGQRVTEIISERVVARSVREFIIRILEEAGDYYFDEPGFSVPPRTALVAAAE
jgi:hypothetical protein